ncbi:retropepsin-like aspartic protease family protein [Roseibium salinum]|uniref:TIGR02281 family clan AA aspartic protease n=1 Tax=Roseibium salinum TaxID=1604349 RepID=A0ABT3R4R3_9HYPH|nr:TIGR02281 family clan AA aspartic protease [Roseibium sp. DSM 29163]MCX2724154.1 TIGR02281 family clan AA aspartic protease [Roseibium sp. DSM 29163]
MTRFIVIFLLCMGIAPFLPGLLESRMETLGGGASSTAYEEADTGERTYRISRDRSGHFVADAYLNGQPVDMLVDTGASYAVLPQSVAEHIGIFLTESDFKYPAQTANGTVYGARTLIDSLRIGSIRLRNVEAHVLKDASLRTPLLGMSVLNELRRFDMSGGTLVLVQ